MKHRNVLALSIFLVSALCGCDYLPIDSEPTQYKNEFVEFTYPGNWDLEEGDVPGTLQYVILDGPSSTQIIIQIYPRENAFTLQEYSEWFSEVFNQSLPFGKMENVSFSPITGRIGTETIDGIREKFSIQVIGVDVPHTRDYFAIQVEQKVIYLVFQSSEDGIEAWNEKVVMIQESFVFH